MTRNMKDSGIEWIGEIPEEWTVSKLKKITEILTCGYASTPEYFDDGVPFISAQNVKNGRMDLSKYNKISKELHNQLTKYKKPTKGDILQVRVGATIGNACIVEEDFDFSVYVSLSHIRATSEIYNYYLYYILSSGTFINEALNETYQGGGVGNLNVKQLKEMYVPVPSKSIQEQIAEYLNKKCIKIDKTIEKQKQIIEKLKEYKQSIIIETVTKGLNPDVKMKDSGVKWIGKIPEHWKVTTIKHLVDITDGTHDTPLYLDKSEHTYALVTSKDFENGNINFDNVKYISKEDYLNICTRSKVEKGDVLMSMIGGNIGKTIIVKGNSEFAIKNVALFRTGENKSLATIINYYLQCKLLKVQIDLKSRGGAQEFMGLGDIRNLVFFGMPKIELKGIANYLDKKCTAIDKSISKKEKLIEKLTEYKKSLIYECVTGKREV